MTQSWLPDLPPEEMRLVGPYEAPTPPSPMLAVLAEPEDVPGHSVYQRKWDGMRVLARTGPDGAALWSRSGRDVGGTFPELVARLDEVDRDTVLDGEVVIVRDGEERFDLLQQRMHVPDPDPHLVEDLPTTLMLLDILRLDRFDVRKLPQRRREQLLQEVIPGVAEIWTARSVATDATPLQVLEASCRMGWEGVIAKDPMAAYRGGRQRSWRKLKCLQRGTFTVVGYRTLEPANHGVGSLVLAEHRDDELHIVGSVGTGITDPERVELLARLEPLLRPRPPLQVEEVRGEVRWVDPAVECEVAYTERTRNGRLRHPRLEGLHALRFPEAPP